MSEMDRLTDEALELLVSYSSENTTSGSMARELIAHRRASQAATASASHAAWLEIVSELRGENLALRQKIEELSNAPSDGLREAWIAGRDAAAAEAFYACGCKDSIEALTPPAAYSRAAPTEGEA